MSNMRRHEQLMIGYPTKSEAPPYYFKYIDRVVGEEVMHTLERQLHEYGSFLSAISEKASLHRYQPDKWSIRQVLSHISDAERTFAFRAFWFARGFKTSLPGFDQENSAAGINADEIRFADHIEEFQAVRVSTISLFKHLPMEAWQWGGVASKSHFTVRALAFIIAGHANHHVQGMKECYLRPNNPLPKN